MTAALVTVAVWLALSLLTDAAGRALLGGGGATKVLTLPGTITKTVPRAKRAKVAP